MRGTISADTFLTLRADEWAALAIGATFVVYVVLAIVALVQLREARRLRIAQARPYVIVDAEYRNGHVHLSIRNVGTTAASDVQIGFDEPLQSVEHEASWQRSTAFTEGVPSLAPGRELRYFLDVWHKRVERDVQLVVRGTVCYAGPTEPYPYEERFVIDLRAFDGMLEPDLRLPELVEEVTKLRTLAEEWTKGTRPLRAFVREDQSRR